MSDSGGLGDLQQRLRLAKETLNAKKAAAAATFTAASAETETCERNLTECTTSKLNTQERLKTFANGITSVITDFVEDEQIEDKFATQDNYTQIRGLYEYINNLLRREDSSTAGVQDTIMRSLTQIVQQVYEMCQWLVTDDARARSYFYEPHTKDFEIPDDYVCKYWLSTICDVRRKVGLVDTEAECFPRVDRRARDPMVSDSGLRVATNQRIDGLVSLFQAVDSLRLREDKKQESIIEIRPMRTFDSTIEITSKLLHSNLDFVKTIAVAFEQHKTTEARQLRQIAELAQNNDALKIQIQDQNERLIKQRNNLFKYRHENELLEKKSKALVQRTEILSLQLQDKQKEVKKCDIMLDNYKKLRDMYDMMSDYFSEYHSEQWQQFLTSYPEEWKRFQQSDVEAGGRRRWK